MRCILLLTFALAVVVPEAVSTQPLKGTRPPELTAEQAAAAAIYEEGVRLRDGTDGPVHLATAFAKFLEAAKLGSPHAQFEAGLAYEFGLGVDQDGQQARYWYATAQASNVYARDRLQVLQTLFMSKFENLDPKVQRDVLRRAPDMLDEAFAWVRGFESSSDSVDSTAAAQKTGPARYAKRGEGMIRYLATSEYRASRPNSGILKARYMLGRMYRDGYGVEPNIDTAVSWFEKAGGYPPASFALAEYYYLKKKDFRRAREYYEKLEFISDRAHQSLRRRAMDMIREINEREAQRRPPPSPQ